MYKNAQLASQHEQICCVTSCEFDEKRATKPKFVTQSRPALYLSQQISSRRKKCSCCATSLLRKVKNLQRNDAARQVKVFLISYFAAFISRHISQLFFRETCCASLATLLRRVMTCWVLQIELVGMPWRYTRVARTWPNEQAQYHATSSKVDHFQT